MNGPSPIQPHSGLQRDFLSDSDHLSVTLSAGSPYAPTVLPTVGPKDYAVPSYSRNLVEVRCVVQAKARLFQTDPQQEINFLNLLKDMQDMSNTITVPFGDPRNC
jgi:hypothetical protein